MQFATLHAHAALAAAVVAAAGLAACGRHGDIPEFPAHASPSAVLVGTAPAPPTGDPPGTTPVTAQTTEVTKLEETQKKPQEGDHAHSTLAPDAAQKAGGQDARPTPAPYSSNEDKSDPTRKPTQQERSKPERSAQ